MKICFVAEVGNRIAGSEQSLLNLIDTLKAYNIEACVVSPRDWELIDELRKRNINVKIVKLYSPFLNKRESIIKKFLKNIIKPIKDRLYMKSLIKFLETNKIDIVHLNSILCCDAWASAALKCNIPYVYHIREFLDKDHNRVLINKKHIYKLIKNANYVIAISNSIKEYWEKKAVGNYCVVYNGVPKDLNIDFNCKKFETKVIHCLIIGRIVETKGQMDAVKAIELLVNKGYHNFQLTIVGYRGIEEYEIKLKEYIEEHDLSDYIDLIDYTYDLMPIKRNCDIGLICSKAEAFGRVTVEYMMSGLLVIGSNSGGTPELIEDGKTGFLYEYGNYESLADKLLYISDNRTYGKQIAKEGQEYALNNFTIEKTAEKVNNIYHEILDKKVFEENTEGGH